MDVKALARTVKTLIAPLETRVLLTLGRGVLMALSEGNHLRAKHGAFAGEALENREVMHDYGFTSRARAGAEVIYGCLAGNRSRSVVLRIADARFRIPVEDGEVALYDDQGQSVHLTREGIVVKGAGLPLTITDTPKVRAETPLLECTGHIRDLCDQPEGRTMADMREAYDRHVHVENDEGGPTEPPSEAM